MRNLKATLTTFSIVALTQTFQVSANGDPIVTDADIELGGVTKYLDRQEEIADDLAEDTEVQGGGQSGRMSSGSVDDTGFDVETTDSSLSLSAAGAQTNSPNEDSGNNSDVGTCKRIWVTGNHTWDYFNGLPFVRVKTKLNVNTVTFLGQPGRPDVCGRPGWDSPRLSHWAVVNSDAEQLGDPLPVAVELKRVTRFNVSSLPGYKSNVNYGTAAKIPKCGFSHHEYTLPSKTFIKTFSTKKCYGQ